DALDTSCLCCRAGWDISISAAVARWHSVGTLTPLRVARPAWRGRGLLMLCTLRISPQTATAKDLHSPAPATAHSARAPLRPSRDHSLPSRACASAASPSRQLARVPHAQKADQTALRAALVASALASS